MWDPEQYLHFADHRGRPFFEPIARIAAESPRRVVDLGCGPGNLTDALRSRWPGALIEALDSSSEMVAAARERGVDAHVADVRDWRPAPDTDVVISNALLQWVPEHRDLLRRWVGKLPAGAWLAMQVPGNFDAPSHECVRQLAATSRWRAALDGVVFRGTGVVDDPLAYADLLADAGCTVDAWETTYVQALTGDHPVLDWITGTALTPVRDALSDEDWEAFCTELIPLLAEAYPQRPDGTTRFPFRRVFTIARTSWD